MTLRNKISFWHWGGRELGILNFLAFQSYMKAIRESMFLLHFEIRCSIIIYYCNLKNCGAKHVATFGASIVYQYNFICKFRVKSTMVLNFLSSVKCLFARRLLGLVLPEPSFYRAFVKYPYILSKAVEMTFSVLLIFHSLTEWLAFSVETRGLDHSFYLTKFALHDITFYCLGKDQALSYFPWLWHVLAPTNSWHIVA